MFSTRIALSDDHPIILMVLENHFLQASEFKVVHVCESGQDLLNALKREPCEIVVTDFSMGEEANSVQGIELLQLLQQETADTAIIVLSGHTDFKILSTIVSQGIQGIVSKQDPLEEVITACRHLQKQKTPYFSATILNALQAS